MRRAKDVPTAWKEEGPACRGEHGERVDAWRVDANETVKHGETTFTGAELIAYASHVCEYCPVQWDCASYAVAIEPTVGTWSVPLDDVKVLIRSGIGEDVIRVAQRKRMTVKEAVARLRAC